MKGKILYSTAKKQVVYIGLKRNVLNSYEGSSKKLPKGHEKGVRK